MLLFIISFLMVFTTSYLITCAITPKNNFIGLLYLPLVAFSQIILTFETLSLFTAISPIGVLFMNFLFLIASIYIWQKKSRPFWTPGYLNFRRKVLNSFKLDKSLAVLYFGFCVFLVATIILCLTMPITSADAQDYHVARSLFWVWNGNLNHFITADIRNLCFPINSELLYTWILVFFKKDYFLGFFGFSGYLLSIVSIYGIMGHLGYCLRKRLWIIFIISSFSSVIVQASGTETDIIMAGLFTSGIYMFWDALKTNKKAPLYMSSLAYAIAIGTKTSAFFAIPGVGILFLALSIYYKKREFYKYFLPFLGFGLINSVVFSSYNYVLNYFDFGNPMGSKYFINIHTFKDYYGPKVIPSNLIKYSFQFLDFTGFRWGDYLTPSLTSLKFSVLKSLNLSYIMDGLFSKDFGVNRTLLEPVMGAGILGFLVFLPCLIWSFFKPMLKSKSLKTWVLFGFSALFILNMIIMSYLLAYMIFNIRFIMFFMVVSSPVLVYSYYSNKNPIKYLIIAFSLFYMMCVSTHLWARPLVKIIPILIKNHSIEKLREISKCTDFANLEDYANNGCMLTKLIKEKYSKDNKILFFPNSSGQLYTIKELSFDGYDIDFRLLEDYKNIDFNKYNAVISTNNGQASTLMRDYEKRKNECKITKKLVIIDRKDPVPCIYYSNEKLEHKNRIEAQYPFASQCFMSDNFMKKQNLEIFDSAGELNPMFQVDNYYIIYENKKRPIKLVNRFKS